MLLSQLSRVALGEVSENLLELLLDLGLHYLFGLYAGEDIRAGGLDVIQQVSLILLDLVNCDILEEVVDNSVDNDYLLLYFQRRVLIRSPFARRSFVSLSRSEPNCAKLCSSLYWE